jgi:enterobactin synthetase component D
MSTSPPSSPADDAPRRSPFRGCGDALALWRAQIRGVPHRLPTACAHAALPLSALDPFSLDAWRARLPSALHSMSSRRLRGFLAGRLCAEAALERLDLPEAVIERGSAGEPRWPSGFVGSIAHTDEVAYAVACRSGCIDALGIDSEPVVGDAKTLSTLQAECCTPRENATLFDGAQDALTATIVFSAKEALYKAIYPRVQRLVEFTEFEATLIDHGQRAAHLRPVLASPLSAVVPPTWVQYCIKDGVVHASVALPSAR